MIAVDERAEAARVRAELNAWSRRLDHLLVELDAEAARRAQQRQAAMREGRADDDDPR